MSLIPYAGSTPSPKKKSFDNLALSSLRAELANMKRKYEGAVALAESRETEIKRWRYNIARLEQRLEEIGRMAECARHSRAPQIMDHVRPSRIVEKVAAYFNMKPDALLGHGRARETTRARHIAIYFIRKMTGESTVMVGRYLGGRDHTTILHGMKNIELGLRVDPLLISQVADIKAAIEESAPSGALAAVPNLDPPSEHGTAALLPNAGDSELVNPYPDPA